MTIQRLVDAKELAEFLKVEANTIYRWARAGRIPSVRNGARFIRFDLDAVLERLENKAAALQA